MKQRVITACALIAIILPIILIGKIPFLIGILLLLSGAMYELTNINKSPLITKIFSILRLYFSIYGKILFLKFIQVHPETRM